MKQEREQVKIPTFSYSLKSLTYISDLDEK